jgi:hypothetical protein
MMSIGVMSAFLLNLIFRITAARAARARTNALDGGSLADPSGPHLGAFLVQPKVRSMCLP